MLKIFYCSKSLYFQIYKFKGNLRRLYHCLTRQSIITNIIFIVALNKKIIIDKRKERPRLLKELE